MKRHSAFTTSVAIPFLAVLVFQALAQETVPSLVKQIAPAVVVITAYGAKGEVVSQGSGFFISADAEVITNAHVLRGAWRAEVKTHDGQVYAIRGVVAEDKEGDLVKIVLESSPKNVPYLQPISKVPAVGERVLVIGNPLGLEQTVSDGIVSAVRAMPPYGTIIQMTAPISPGSSGSPVVNLKSEVIGIATFQVVMGQNLNFAIPSERVTKLKAGPVRSLGAWSDLAPALEIEVQHFQVVVRHVRGVGIYLIMVDFWDKPFHAALLPAEGGQVIYRFKCDSPCKARAADLNAEQYKTVYEELRLQRIEDDLSALRRQIRRICSWIGC